MKFTLTGALGNVSKPLTEILIRAGHQVMCISNDAGKKDAIEALLAKAAIVSLTDIAFLSFIWGADAVYTMVPPNWEVTDYHEYTVGIGRN